MRDIPAGGWVKIVGSSYEASYLDAPVLRKRSAALPVKDRRPAVRKLSTPDGREYKLLYVPDQNRKVHEILRMIRPLQSESFVSKLLWSDANNLLFEFIPGEYPKLNSEKFSADLGKVLATLHSYRFPNISRLRYRLEFFYNLSSLQRHDLVDARRIEAIKSLYASTRPSHLQRSLDYFDLKQNNFIYDESGHLRLIDAGAFRNNRPTGQFLLGSSNFSKLNKQLFLEAYKCAGGSPFMYENENYLKLFHYVMKTGQRARLFAAEPDKTTAKAEREWQRCMKSRDSLLSLLDAL